jgi:hypothetical protein
MKVSCAGILSSTWYGNTALPQCMLCINGLEAVAYTAFVKTLNWSTVTFINEGME